MISGLPRLVFYSNHPCESTLTHTVKNGIRPRYQRNMQQAALALICGSGMAFGERHSKL